MNVDQEPLDFEPGALPGAGGRPCRDRCAPGMLGSFVVVLILADTGVALIAPASAMERSAAAVTARSERGVGPATVLRSVPRVGLLGQAAAGRYPSAAFVDDKQDERGGRADQVGDGADRGDDCLPLHGGPSCGDGLGTGRAPVDDSHGTARQGPPAMAPEDLGGVD